MRITNKIISNNSVTNINNNKVYEDKIGTQLATGSKINRPSDDPVVAIRALRLRTNLNEVNQYYSKNIPDANSWLDVTESAVDTTIEVIKDMYANCTKGAAGFQTSEDRAKVLEHIKALQKEVYATADADYAGRYVFSGYRTNTPVSFGQTTEKTYTITEQVDSNLIDSLTYVDVKELDGLTRTNAEGLGVTERDVEAHNDIHRMRLSYKDVDEGMNPVIEYYDNTGAKQTLTAQTISLNSKTQDPYLSADSAPDGVVFIPETGELILSDAAFDKLKDTKDIPDAIDADEHIDEGEIRITYQKTNFEASDIRPEHFFYCESDGVTYNSGYLDGQTDDDTNQFISYDVGYNQSVRVNTLAKEVFSPIISRDVDDMIHAIEDVDKMEKNMATIKDMLSTDPDNEDLKDRLKAIEKSYTFLNDKMQKTFESNITKMQNHLNKANDALTAVGNRTLRVELVSNRLSKQKVNFQTLSSENEDIDMSEAAVTLGSVQLAYQAALMATGKISQTTLLNYL